MNNLSVDCISHILSFLSPREAARLALVSQIFRDAVRSDVLWIRYLPPWFRIPNSLPFLNFLSKKDIYFFLCENPIQIGSSEHSSFKLDKYSGKICLMIGAKDLFVHCPSSSYSDSNHWLRRGGNHRYVLNAYLLDGRWIYIKGRVKTKKLSPETRYAAYFVFSIADAEERHGLETPVECKVFVIGRADNIENVNVEGIMVVLDPPELVPDTRLRRRDRWGWYEIEMGEFFSPSQHDNTVVVCSLSKAYPGSYIAGLVVGGIELRPKP